MDGHHLKSGNLRRGHEYLIGLCKWHHAGRLYVEGWDHKAHRLHLGASLAEGADPFHEQFGSDEELLMLQNERLRDMA